MIIEFLHQVKKSFESIKGAAASSGSGWSERESQSPFYRTITPEIEKIDLLLDGLLGYLTLGRPVTKKDKLYVFIEEVLREKKSALREKQARLFKRFEEGIPEPALSDEELRFVLSALLDHALALLPMRGEIGFLVKSILPRERGAQPKIKMFLFFSGGRSLGKPLNLILRLVGHVVERNQGVMELQEDKERKKIFVRLILPARDPFFS